MMPKYPEIEVQLVGEDGNAFAILGQVRRAMRNALPPTEFTEAWALFEAEATSGDYDHLLQTVMQWVEVV